MSGDVAVTLHAQVATVTVDREEKRNALDRSTLEALAEAFHHLSLERSLSVVILRGAGEVAFSAGADLREYARFADEGRSRDELDAALDRCAEAIRSSPALTIAAINGHCIGAGAILSLLCDVRVANAALTWTLPVVRLGASAPFAAVSRLCGLVGFGRATEILALGRSLGAAEALACGLVSRVTDPGSDAAEVAVELARVAATGSRQSVAHLKRQLRAIEDSWNRVPGELWDALRQELCDGEDYRVGLAAALRREAPDFNASGEGVR